MINTRIIGLTTAIILSVPSHIVIADEPGQDNPLVSRFEGATMHLHHESEYDAVTLPNASVPRSNYSAGGVNIEAAQDAVVSLEGRTSWISYQAPDDKSTLEILHNYQSALTQDGFDVVFSCHQQSECGPGIGRYVRNIVFPDGYWSRSSMSIRPGYVLRGDTRAMLAQRIDDHGTVHIFLYLDDDSTPPAIHQVVVESETMQTGQVETGVRTASELQEALDTEGRAIVEGIYFEFDSAEILPESSAALEQMATLMNDTPDIHIYIVGHTDSQGSLDYNRDLSTRRAEAVLQALTDDYDIDSARMAAHGVASLAPIASNSAEDGRAMNRRVELVLQ